MESYPEQCHDPIGGRTFTKCYPDGTGCNKSGAATPSASPLGGKTGFGARYGVPTLPLSMCVASLLFFLSNV